MENEVLEDKRHENLKSKVIEYSDYINSLPPKMACEMLNVLKYRLVEKFDLEFNEITQSLEDKKATLEYIKATLE